MHSKRFIGKTIHSFNTLDSTNSFAKAMISDNFDIAVHGHVVVASEQTQGRGQFGNSWYSKKNESLTCSILLEPDFLMPSQQFMIAKITALALVYWLKDVNVAAEIKWPNDIYVHQKKIAGILIENMIQHQCIKHSIVGIGVNINQNTFPENLPFAYSLFLATEAQFDIAQCLDALLNHYDIFYAKLENKKFDEINELYLQHLLGFQQELDFEINGKQEKGIIRHVNHLGQLEVFVNEKKCVFNHKEIKFLPF